MCITDLQMTVQCAERATGLDAAYGANCGDQPMAYWGFTWVYTRATVQLLLFGSGFHPSEKGSSSLQTKVVHRATF